MEYHSYTLTSLEDEVPASKGGNQKAAAAPPSPNTGSGSAPQLAPKEPPLEELSKDRAPRPASRKRGLRKRLNPDPPHRIFGC